jgi:hypothetical protein
MEKTFATSTTPHLTIAACMGNLEVRGGEVQQVTLRLHNGNDVAVVQEGETLTTTISADCAIVCPRDANLTIRTAHGNVTVRNVRGSVSVGVVNGNGRLRALGPTDVGEVYGNLIATEINGVLSVQTAHGNARIHQVQGPLSLGQVGGSLRASGLLAGVSAENVGADVRLGPPFAPSAAYRLTAGSDLRVRLPADASLRLTLKAGGGVRSRIPGLVLEEGEGETRGALGAGEATLEAWAGGRITLRPANVEDKPAEDWGLELGLEDLGAQIEVSVNRAMAEVNARLAENLGHVDAAAIQRHVERATERSLHAAERGIERARREAEQARIRAERVQRRWQRAGGQQPRRVSVTDDERLRVLRLVEAGKATPEQAAELLAALEGR